MGDIDFNENTFYFCCKEVSSLNDSMKSFSGQLSGLGSLSGELTSALLIECQNMIKMYTNKVGDLNDRVQKIKEVTINKFPSIDALFAFYDEGLINEFGEFDLGEETVKITSFDMRTAKNGTTYFAMQTQNGDHIYLSGDCLEGPNVLECYFPGIGGLNQDYSLVTQDIKETGVPSNTIMAIARKCDNASFLNTVDEIVKNSNLTVSGIHVTTFSGSGATGFIALNEYLKEHPEIEDVSMVSCDGYYIANNLINGENPYVCDELIKRNVPIAMVDPTMAYWRNGSDLNVAQMTEALKAMGYNTTYIKENSGTMHDCNFIGKVVKDGLGRYLAGTSNELSNSSDYSYTR